MNYSHNEPSYFPFLIMFLFSFLIFSCTPTAIPPSPSITSTPQPAIATQPASPTTTTELDQEEVMQLWHRLSPSDFGLEDHAIFCLDWSPDGSRVAAGDSIGSLIVWDAPSGNIIHHLPSDRRILDCDWSGDGEVLVSGSGPDLWLWDAVGGLPLDRLSGIGGLIKGVTISPDSAMVASWAAGEKSGRVWSIVTGEHLLALPHTHELDRLAWSPDSTAIAASTREQLVTVWDIANGQKIIELAHNGIVLDLAWSPDGLLLMVGHSEGLTIWDVRTWAEGPIMELGVESARTVEWSPDGGWIAIESGWLPSTIEVWDVVNQTRVFSLATLGGYLSDLSWSPDGSWLAAGFNDSTVAIWDMKTGIWVGIGRHETDDVELVAWSPDSRTLATADDVGIVNLWQLNQ